MLCRAAAAAALLLSSFVLAASGQDADPIKAKLDKVRAAYDNEALLYNQGVRDWFAKREEAARAKGDKKLVDAIKVELVAFDETGELPKTAPLAPRTKYAAARKAMAAAYTEAVKEYTKAKKDAEASAVEADQTAFAKADAVETPAPKGGKPPASIPVGVRPAGENPCARPAERNTARHLQLVEKAKRAGPVDVVLIGDSHVVQWESAGKAAWAEKYAAVKAFNLGAGGDRTEHILWRLTEGKALADLNPKVAVVLTGSANVENNPAKGATAEQIAGGVRAVVLELRKQKPDMKVLLVGLLPVGSRVPGPAPDPVPASMLNPKVKAVNAIIRRLDNGSSIRYLDFGDKLLDRTGGLPKRISPNANYLGLTEEAFDIWADAMEKPLAAMLKE